MRDESEIFPKSDLMVGALEPLIGESIFVTDGEKWRRQRAMIDPAFSHMRITHAFASMRAAVDTYEAELEAQVEQGERFSLDLAMSHLTADVICRTVFSIPLQSDVTQEVFDAFTIFERSVAQVEILRLIFSPAWSEIRQPPEVLAACERIRFHLGALIDTHLAPNAEFDDIASVVAAARDTDSGKPFTREELIDQLGVFFLAGHETTASVLTWVFYILAQQPHILARLRQEISEVIGDGEVEYEHTRKLPYARAVFRETLRLYPPITFIPRVALRAATVGTRRLKRGALVMIAPWTLHRHRDHWEDPHAFLPERFLPENEKDLVSGAYIPFGLGPHTCVGAGFALIESVLIIARLVRRFDFVVENASAVRPAARLTTRPAEQIYCTARFRS